MDIVAKHIPADKDGIRIAELDEHSYRKNLWDHKPLTDFWRVGHGIVQRLFTRVRDKKRLVKVGDLVKNSYLYR